MSGATLNQEEEEHRKNLEGLLIRKASLEHFFLHAGLQMLGNLAVGEADKKGIAH